MGLFDFARPKPTKNLFADLVMTRLRARGWREPLHYDRDCFSIASFRGEHILCLGRIYEDWAVSRKRMRPAEIDKLVSLALEHEQDPDFAASRELRAAIERQVQAYLTQEYELNEALDLAGRDVFVAPLEVRDDRGELVTWTSWAEGVPALLPRSHYVAAMAANGEHTIRRWEDVEAVCGVFQAEPNCSPERLIPPPWPSAEAWNRLVSKFGPRDAS